MAQVTALAQWRDKKMQRPTPEAHHPSSPPLSAVFDKDYNALSGKVFGVLAVKEILKTHFPFEEEWKHDLFEVLEAVALSFGADAPETKLIVRHRFLDLKSWILDAMRPENKRDLSMALLVLDLMEKSALSRTAPMTNPPESFAFAVDHEVGPES